MDGSLRSMRNQKRTLRHILWRCGAQSNMNKKELLEATPLDDLYAVPAHVITDDSVLVTVVEE
eukprot:2534759-Pyramimonas_sp.AAC.1